MLPQTLFSTKGRLRMSAASLRLTPLVLALVFCAPLPGCTRDAMRDGAPKAPETSATAMHDRPDTAHSTSSDGAPAPVAQIGSYAFRFPAQAFADQHGPYPDGSVALVLLWPSLAPAAPGSMPAHDAARVRIGAAAVAASESQAPLARFVEPDPTEPAQRDDPTRNLALRREGAAVHELTPYYIDIEAAQTYLRGRAGAGAQDAPVDSMLADTTFSDWYLARDGGRLSSVIVCDEARVPDGVREEGGRLLSTPDADAVAACAHHFTLADGDIRVSIDYPRALLRDWRRIEDAVRTLFDTHRVR
jgi:hypothetical protein